MRYSLRSNKPLFGNVGIMVAIAVILLVFFSVLSYFLYQKIATGTPVPVSSSGKASTQNNTQQAEVVLQDDRDSFVFLPLSEDERKILKPPVPSASSEEMAIYGSLVQKVAVASEKLAVGVNCKIQPVVVKVQKGANLELKNYDSTPHTIRFDEKRSFLIPASGSITAPVDFPKEVGMYGYACDDHSGPAGIVFIVE